MPSAFFWLVTRMSKQSEEYRLWHLGQLKEKYGESDPPEVLEAKKVIANYCEEKANAGPKIARLSFPLPAPDLCSPCWFEIGHKNLLQAVATDDPSKYDRGTCRVCGYAEDRDAP